MGRSQHIRGSAVWSRGAYHPDTLVDVVGVPLARVVEGTSSVRVRAQGATRGTLIAPRALPVTHIAVDAVLGREVQGGARDRRQGT